MSVIPPRVSPQHPAVATPQPMPELGETLRVINTSPTDTYRFAWNSRQYVLPPSASEFMPFDAVKVYTGDPRATNNVRTSRDSIGIVSFLPDRATEVRRLRLLYAAPFGEYMRAGDVGGIFVNTTTANADSLASKFAWEGVRIPQVEVYNIRNERIWTVLDDPEGAMTIPVALTRHDIDSRHTDHLQALIQQQANVIEALSARLGIDPNSPALDNHDDILDEPEPSTPDNTNDDGTPRMVYDPHSDTIKRKPIRHQDSDPTTIDDLPEDRI